MPPRMKRTAARATRKRAQHPLEDEVQSALTWLERHSTKRTREGMARYGIPSDNAFGVSVANIRVLAKRLGRNHELAAALWDTGPKSLTSLTSTPRSTSSARAAWRSDTISVSAMCAKDLHAPATMKSGS